MKTFHATSLDLRHYVTDTYVYPPKNIVVDAIQITAESIGGLCLEYEADMMWDHEVGAHFVIWAHRNEGAPVSLLLRPGFWLVPLRGEIHRFDDYTFENTFYSPDDHEALMRYAREDVAASAQLAQKVAHTFPYQQPMVRFEVSRQKIDDLIAKSSIGEGAQPPTPEEMEQVASSINYPDGNSAEEMRQTAEHLAKELGQTDALKFHQSDRVVVKGTNRLGTVSVVGVEENGVLKVEAVMDADGLYYLFEPEQLQKLDGKDELRKLREKLMQDPDTSSMTEQVEWEQPLENPIGPKNLFKTEDRVRVVGTEDYGTVVEPLADGGVEVLLDNTGQTYAFHANQLERVYPEIGTDQVKD